MRKRWQSGCEKLALQRIGILFTVSLLTLLFLVLTVHAVVSQEKQAGMERLQAATPAGRKKQWLYKQLVLLFAVLAVWGIASLTELVRIQKTYGSFACLSAPLYSLPMLNFFSRFPSLTLGQTMALYYFLRLITVWAAAQVCFFLSGLCRKNKTALLLCSGGILLPAALSAIGTPVGNYTSFLLPLMTDEVFHRTAPFLAVILVGVTAMLLSIFAGKMRRGLGKLFDRWVSVGKKSPDDPSLSPAS